MYGMVNRAIEEMVTSRYGTAVWEGIKARAKVDVDLFISHDPYPDDITYRLVSAASVELSVSADVLLEGFGRFWILHTAERGYAEMMRAGGQSLPDFLEALPGFHTRVAMIFPELVPPRFQVTDRGANSLRLHYHTQRDGLTAFARGLIYGLGERFGTPLRVTLEAARADGADHDVFLVDWSAEAQS